jgi:SAM-dependent methyltransferase
LQLFRALADYKSLRSPARRFRERRFDLFRSLASRLPRPLQILDVGGTESFWQTLGFLDEPGVSITTLNLDLEPGSGAGKVKTLQGDARDLSRFSDRSFDIVFSNSLIEHVGGIEDQRRAADEMRRVGKAFFVQTPNKNFPIEPHFLFPFFQFLPVPARVFLLTHFSLGWYGKLSDREQALRVAQEIQLLERRTVCELFPSAQIWEERLFGLVKSFVAYSGFPPNPA